MKIYFVTTNETKIQQSQRRLERFIQRIEAEEGARLDLELCAYQKRLDELMDFDIERIVTKKALAAYQMLGLPCVVEHGGLYLDAWRSPNGERRLLGGIGQVVWEAVGDRMCDFLREDESRKAEAQSVVGYCDGRRVHVYSGTTHGEITDRSRGDHGYRWDPIFKPAGSELTYGEMSPEARLESSPDEKAWELFFESLLAGQNAND